jgi:hypothetical protein
MTIQPLELTNADSTRLVSLTKFSYEVCVRSSQEQPWFPVKVDQDLAKQALKVIKDAPKTLALRKKLQVREAAISNLIHIAAPDVSWDKALKARVAICS